MTGPGCRRLLLPLVVAACTPVVSSVSWAQGVPEFRLGSANGLVSEEFTFVQFARELADGRVILTDGRETRVVAADLASGEVMDLGRTGQGPGEYSMVWPVHALPGDSSLMATPGRRWLVFHGGRIVHTVPLDAPAIDATRGFVVGADSLGHVMTIASPPTRNGVTSYTTRDSLWVVLVDRATGEADTVARVRRPLSTVQATVDAAGRIRSIQVTHAPVFNVQEASWLFTDGWLAIARLDPYRVDWRAPDGRWIRGAPIVEEPVRVTNREKRAFVERRARRWNRPAASPDAYGDWPETLPPWSGDEPVPAPLIGTRDGRLLVLRTRTADHPETRYDIIDRRGVREAQLLLAENERIVGFGARSVYVVAKDEVDLETVRRHPWPPRP